jgi:hypothetical protein
MIKDMVLVMNHRPAPMSSRHRCLRDMALQIKIGRARNVCKSATPTRGTHDDEKDNGGCKVRADGFTTIEVVDGCSDVGVGIRHDNGLWEKDMSKDDTI